MHDNNFITPKEIAALLKVSTTTVYNWVAKGILPAKQPSKLIFITRKDFERFMEESER